ncbi:hypothetical protein L9F63_002924, partial [Diploptera punctata]
CSIMNEFSPGAKERLVQITGPSEDQINHAKHLMEDTIRRNASPVRIEQPDKQMGGSSSSLNSSASDESNRYPGGIRRSALLHSFSTNDASLGEYKYTVTVGNQSIKITGTNLDLVRTLGSSLIPELQFSKGNINYEKFAGSNLAGFFQGIKALYMASSAKEVKPSVLF